MNTNAPAMAALEDPLRFVLRALELEGALAERAGDRATALLPPALAERLSVTEELHLALYPERASDTPAGIGSPLLEKLVGEARRMAPVAGARALLEPPRPSHARSVAERFALRNGLTEIVQITFGAGDYLASSVAYVIEADDRREGLLSLLTASDGAEPDSALLERIDLGAEGTRLKEVRDRVWPGSSAKWTALRAARAIQDAAAKVILEIGRRHARDHERIADYFAQLGAEARSPRRKTDPAAIDAKLAHLAEERDKKMAALGARYATRITGHLAALVAVEVPVAFVEMKLRRRKADRRITLRVPAGGHAVDRPACEGCGVPTARPAACDDAVHLLCETCAPNAQGRFACPACR